MGNPLHGLASKSASLHEREVQYRAVIETSMDGFWMVDMEGRLLEVNDAYARCSGYSREELLAMRISDVEFLENPADTAAHIEKVLREGYDRFESLHRTKDGRIWPVEVVTSYSPVNSGRLFVFLRDITERKQVEEKLLKSEERFRMVANSIPQLAWIARADGHIIWYNQRWYEYTGTAQEEMEGWGWQSAHDPDVLPEVIAQWKTSIATGKPFDMVFPLRGADGRFRPFLSRGVPLLDSQGNVIQWFGTNTDISDRKRMEDALREREEFNRRIIASSADCIKVLDLAGNLLSMSEGGQRLLEIDDIGRYLNGCWIDFWQERDRPAVTSAIATARSAGVGQFQAYCPSEKGTPKWWDVVISPILGPDGKAERLLAVSRDVTDHKQIEDALKAAKAEAERANNAKSRFLASASHDLRQPLFALDLYVSSLENKLAPGNERLLKNMKDNLASLSEMLAKLLDLSKLEAGVVVPEVADFAVADIFDKIVSAHAPEAKLKGLSLRCATPRHTAHTDPVLFERVLGNLVSNAVCYTDRGGVLIGCRRREGKTWVEVWDTGMGIPEDKTAEIFEEFKQLGNEERSREKGSGLGLAIVAKTVDLLGLKIRVQSRLGKGSLFAVELPLGQKETQALTQGENQHRPLRIAVVDDDVGVRESLIFVLEEAGHEVVAAATGDALLAHLKNLPPDVVISDYRLANGENGFNAITAVRTAFGIPVPAVILTGDTDPELIRSMTNKGVLVQHKPLTFPALQACIDGLTRGHAAPNRPEKGYSAAQK